jgi:hypothetical protein
MANYFGILFIMASTVLTSAAYANSYKCVGQSINPDVVRYETTLSFHPVGFQLDTYLKEDDGSWSVTSEVLADSGGVLKPLKISWSVCEVRESSSASGLSYSWSKGNAARGHFNIDLTSATGEFYSSASLGGTVHRRIAFSNCTKLP